MGTNYSLSHPVILFDGICNLCNAFVQFILERDKTGRFRFASLQSNFAKEKLSGTLSDEPNLQSIVLWHQGHSLTKSTAALTISKQLSGLWPLLYGLIIIPKPVRDGIYDYIAKNRYKWFGKKEQCMLPSPKLESLFLE